MTSYVPLITILIRFFTYIYIPYNAIRSRWKTFAVFADWLVTAKLFQRNIFLLMIIKQEGNSSRWYWAIHVIVYGGFVILILPPSNPNSYVLYGTQLHRVWWITSTLSKCIWEHGLLLDLRCKQLQPSPLTLELKAFNLAWPIFSEGRYIYGYNLQGHLYYAAGQSPHETITASALVLFAVRWIYQ